MLRWIDSRDALPPQGMTVLVYVRDNSNEIYRVYITSAQCFYEIKIDENNCHENELPDWVLKNVTGEDLAKTVRFSPSLGKSCIDAKNEILDTSEWSIFQVTHWTLMPAFSSSFWIDIDKYPPPMGLEVLLYMKDSCEDKEDFITSLCVSHFPVNNFRHSQNDNKYFYKPVAWTLRPCLPKLTMDDFL